MTFDYTALANYGTMGIMLLWFMFRTETQNEKTRTAIDNNTIALNQFSATIEMMKKQ